MTVIELATHINAPLERCFDLSRSIELHLESTKQTGEKAIAGRTSGLMELAETVTWSARHFFIRQTLTSKITEFNYPYNFTDEMVAGPFKWMRHEHLFYPIGNQTLMKDLFMFESPFGIFGELANSLFLGRYMQYFLLKRNQTIKKIAESPL